VERAFARKRRPGPNLGGTFVGRDQMRVQAQPPPATARVVCRPCNNNWLSVIDNAAATVLKPLIRGSGTVKLDLHAQLAFATWLLKIALVFDAMDAGDNGRLAAQRKPFYELRQPPIGPLIYAGPAPAIPWTVPGFPEVAGMRLFGLRPLDGVLNLHLRVANADGTPAAEQPRGPTRIPIAGYQIMLGSLFAYVCSRIKFFNLTDEYVQIWPIVADEVEITV
jgi:hypothetical protein